MPQIIIALDLDLFGCDKCAPDCLRLRPLAKKRSHLRYLSPVLDLSSIGRMSGLALLMFNKKKGGVCSKGCYSGFRAAAGMVRMCSSVSLQKLDEKDGKKEGASKAEEALKEDGPKEDGQKRPAANDDISALRQEVSNLKKEKNVLQKKVEEAERKAAELEDTLCRLPSETRRELTAKKPRAASEPAEQQAPEKQPSKDKEKAEPLTPKKSLPRIESMAEKPSRLPSRQPSASLIPQQSKKLPPHPSPQPSSTSLSKEVTTEEPTRADTKQQQPKIAEQPKEEEELPSALAAARRPEMRATEGTAPWPMEKEEKPALTSTPVEQDPEKTSPSRPLSHESSLQWLRKRLTRIPTPKEDTPERGQSLRVRRLGSPEECVKCQALTHEKETLEAELKTVSSRCEHLETEVQEDRRKRQALIAKVSKSLLIMPTTDAKSTLNFPT